MGKFINYDRNGGGSYRIKLDPHKLLEHNLHSNRWRDLLDEQIGWKNWNLERDTTTPSRTRGYTTLQGQPVSGGFIYVALRDKTACFAARLFLDMCAAKFKDGKLYEYREIATFREPKRQYVHKREEQLVFFSVSGLTDLNTRERFHPTLEEITAIIGAFLIEKFEVFELGVQNAEGNLLYVIKLEDKLAENRFWNMFFPPIARGYVSFHKAHPRDAKPRAA